MQEILRKDCELPLRLRLVPQDRDVIVATGKFRFTPIGQEKHVVIYGKVFGEREGGGGSGNLDQFLRFLGAHIGEQIVNEAEGPEHGAFAWRERHQPFREDVKEDRDEDSVLRHVSEQTGLTFTKEKRSVPVVVVDRAE
jgi:hypothetical protein